MSTTTVLTKLRKRLCIFFYIQYLFLPHLVFSHGYSVKTYSLEEGLAQSQALCLLNDNEGYLWIGTYGGGLSKYDGNKFTNYTVKDGLNDNAVHSIYQDQDNTLWIATENGINKYNSRQFTSYKEKDGLSHNNTRTILGDIHGKQRDIWIATFGGGINRFDGTSFTHYTTREGLNSNNVNFMMRDSHGNYWIGTENGAAEFDGKTFRQFNTGNGMPGNDVRFICEDKKGRLWFATEKGACRFDGITFTPFTVREGLCNNDVRAITEDSAGNMWFATADGLSHFNGINFAAYTTREGLGSNLITNIIEDREKNIWLATDLGITKLSRSPFYTITREDGLNDNTVWSLWEDPEGTMWISTDKGISLFNEQNIPHLSQSNYSFKGTAYPFYEDRRGILRFGTSTRLVQYRNGVFSDISKQTGTEAKDILSIFEDQKGNLWFGTRRNGVIRYRFSNGRHTAAAFTTDEGLIDNTVNTIAEDRKGRIWFGTSEGISIYDNGSITSITTDDWLTNRFVTTILSEPTDEDGSIWIGTFGGGVIRCLPSWDIRDSVIDNFTTADGLRDNEILLMIFDKNRHLWIGTNKGVGTLNVSKFKKTGKKNLKFYGREDGFTGMECNQNAVYKDRNGNLWFGTIKGATKYEHAKDTVNPIEPITHITGLKLFMESADLSAYSRSPSQPEGSILPDGLELPYDKNHLTFEFIGIHLTTPEKVRYRVKLERFDQSWSPESKATYAVYSNLPPGTYIFKVKACNNSGVWNKAPITYRFKILSPFWKTWWFYCLCAITGITLIYSYILLHTRNLKKQQQWLEEKVQQRTRELEEEKAKVEQINTKLEQRVRERTEKLVITSKQLLQAQKMEAIGTLAGGVAHDLNNVLAGIISYPELLLMKIPEDSPMRKYLINIKKSGEKAASMVQDLLTLARRGVDTREIISLNQVISEALKSPEIEKLKLYHPKVEIKTSFEENLLNLSGSPVHISKSIVNLISNATDAMPDGGIVSISTKNKYLEQDHAIKGYNQVKEGDYILLTVSDTGVGISTNDIDRIFEPFYTKKEMGRSGTGLGMTVVWSTVQDHHGYITVDSIENRGTVITIYLPGTREEPLKEKFQFSINEYMGKGQTILAVDDVPEQRDVITLILTELKYSVTTVDSGEAALDYIAKNPVDLVILDMIMDPGIDGLETYRRILRIRPHQRAIIVSGYSETERVKEALQLGAGAYVKKPYLMEEIGLAVKRELMS